MPPGPRPAGGRGWGRPRTRGNSAEPDVRRRRGTRRVAVGKDCDAGQDGRAHDHDRQARQHTGASTASAGGRRGRAGARLRRVRRGAISAAPRGLGTEARPGRGAQVMSGPPPPRGAPRPSRCARRSNVARRDSVMRPRDRKVAPKNQPIRCFGMLARRKAPPSGSTAGSPRPESSSVRPPSRPRRGRTTYGRFGPAVTSWRTSADGWSGAKD